MRTNRPRLAARHALAAAWTALAAVPVAAQTAAPAPVSVAPNGVGSAFELTFWQSVIGSEDIASYEAYLARYPDGTFSGLARARIAAIQRSAAIRPAAVAVSAAEPAAAPQPAPAPAPAPTAQPAPAVLILPQAANPPAPASAAAMVTPAPTIAPTIATATAASASAGAETAPSPMARLLAQLRATGEPVPAPATAGADRAPAAPAQPLDAPAPAAADAAPLAASYASARPLMIPVPELVLPAYFCSNEARNQFHNTAYRPAMEAATRNNEAAVAYLRQLQQAYDRGQLGRDTEMLNAIAAEARAYQAEAARAYTAQAALVRQFDAIMAVPLHTCLASVP